ncbi:MULTISPECIES: FAD-dependent oxidoreductase [Mycobacterium]|uniref:FAD-dependent oxidoreductase n=1 Tax=Mycobacterium TaxID=1763 RepID=UPI001CDA113D|nr:MULTISPECIES: FAD-dependent oxidoreductase [Mycobacterium]MCA2241978.1 FAD-dependent oxidoreductase [Mycobacterium sp. WUMAC-067]MCA2314504.1 FAD-dependent oxidoreductase [Mycobacterium sp. WUMAC-025]MEE3751983.1 FAD-dependent oxidoreductase [Mycobacterium intracellulare]
MNASRQHAIVLGAGIAGLLAARVLSDFYDSVSVIERDKAPGHPVHRKGVPQGRHVHMFLSRGTQVLAELFPGLIDELGAAGATVINDGDLSRFYVRTGRYELQRSGTLTDPTAVTLCLASRPFVEFHVHRRVAALSNVTLLDGHDVIEPLAAGEAVTGARILHRDNGAAIDVPADLVVDAMGRSARTPALLELLGYGRPPETRSTAMLGYSSQLLSMPTGCLDKQMVVFNLGGGGKPGGLLLACENDTWMFAVGRTIDTGGAPPDFATMLALADRALPPEIIDGLRRAQPLADIATFRNPAAVWRRYDQMPRFPRGLLVIGDALCSPNPVYGQGMTMAAQQALALRDCLRGGDADLAQRFFHMTARDIGPTWAMNQANDRVPSPTLKPSLSRRLRGQLVGAMLNAAGDDTAVTESLLRVTHLVDPPARLQDPTLLLRVLRATLRRRFHRAQQPRRHQRLREAL